MKIAGRYNSGMFKNIRNTLTSILVYLVCASAVWAAPAAAPAPAAPPEPPVIEAANSWLTIAYAVVGLVGICVVAFKNARRTHLD